MSIPVITPPKAALIIAQPENLAVQNKTSSRLIVLDMLRGIAMLLMALDHAAFFSLTGMTAESYNGIKPKLETWPHILSGLLTNIATPIFIFWPEPAWLSLRRAAAVGAGQSGKLRAFC